MNLIQYEQNLQRLSIEFLGELGWMRSKMKITLEKRVLKTT